MTVHLPNPVARAGRRAAGRVHPRQRRVEVRSALRYEVQLLFVANFVLVGTFFIVLLIGLTELAPLLAECSTCGI